MPRLPEVWQRQLVEWIRHLEGLKYSPYSFKSYKCAVRKAHNALESAGRNTNPHRVGAEDVLFVVNDVFRNDSRLISAWNNYLKFNGNAILELTPHRSVILNRHRADWLDLDRNEDLTVWESADSPLEVALVHSELHLCMRSVEVHRQHLSWFALPHVHILGKGKYPGKWRTIMAHPYTKETLNALSDFRAECSRQVGQELPDKLMAYAREKVIIDPHPRTLDNILAKVSKRSGIHFSHHTLRRTGGRKYWRAAVSACQGDLDKAKNILPQLQKFLGHESMDMTVHYLGIDLDDMGELMALSERYDLKRTSAKPTIQV